MNKAILQPYIIFNGNCEEAMDFYQSILGGTLEISRFGDSPMEIPDEQKDKVMHAALQNDSLSFMASDSTPDMRSTVGNNVQLSLTGSGAAFLRESFAKLSVDGNVQSPLEKQFWGDEFGMLTDKFGIRWMINISATTSDEDE